MKRGHIELLVESGEVFGSSLVGCATCWPAISVLHAVSKWLLFLYEHMVLQALGLRIALRPSTNTRLFSFCI